MKKLIHFLLAVVIILGTVLSVFYVRESRKRQVQEKAEEQEEIKEEREVRKYLVAPTENDTDDNNAVEVKNNKQTGSRVDQSYNYLSKVELLQKCYIKEKDYLVMGQKFNDYVTDSLHTSGENFVIKDFYKTNGSLVIKTKGFESDDIVFIVYTAKDSTFQFYQNLPEELEG